MQTLFNKLIQENKNKNKNLMKFNNWKNYLSKNSLKMKKKKKKSIPRAAALVTDTFKGWLTATPTPPQGETMVFLLWSGVGASSTPSLDGSQPPHERFGLWAHGRWWTIWAPSPWPLHHQQGVFFFSTFKAVLYLFFTFLTDFMLVFYFVLFLFWN